jgi:ubiquinone/menaquinone biosynthesis C-methylase UbiE
VTTDNEGQGPENDLELRARRASSFGAQALAYADHRPDYPAAAVEWILQSCEHPPKHVLDLAAGTGKLTGGLFDFRQRFAPDMRVTAVEPDPAMRAELVQRYPDATAVDGTAERIPLGDAAVDAVLVGQAFHWFDTEPALAEIARVLRPGGALGALWNRDDERVPWVAELGKLTTTGASQRWSAQWRIPERAEFDRAEQAMFEHAHRRTAESLTATIGTHSNFLVVPEEERAAVLDRILAYLRSRPEIGRGEFDFPLRTTTIRARRR